MMALVRQFNAYAERDTQFVRRRELPTGAAVLWFNLGPELRVEHPLNTQTAFAEGTGFYSGPSAGTRLQPQAPDRAISLRIRDCTKALCPHPPLRPRHPPARSRAAARLGRAGGDVWLCRPARSTPSPAARRPPFCAAACPMTVGSSTKPGTVTRRFGRSCAASRRAPCLLD
jgi:hypothetical protein